MSTRSGDRRLGSSAAAVLIVLLAIAVGAATVLAYSSWRDQYVLDPSASTVLDAGPVAESPAPPSRSPSPSKPATAAPPPGPRPVSLWIGDGFTGGSGLEDPRSGYACAVAQELDWQCRLDGTSGTGFVAAGATSEPLIDRLDDLSLDARADFVIIDAGRNDLEVAATTTIVDAIETYVASVTERFPDATVVLVVPWTRSQAEPLPAELTALFADLEAAGDVVVVDPYAEGWAGAGSTDLPELSESGGRLSPAGHDYVAEQLSASLVEALALG